LEYINRQADRSAAFQRHTKFGLLQVALQESRTNDYLRRTGRPVDEERDQTIEALLIRRFPEFRHTSRNGVVRWARTWTGQTTRDLARASSNPLRESQYAILFSAWSEQAHASPGALLQGFAPSGAPLEQVIATDDVRIAETVSSALTWFVELWLSFRSVPPPDHSAVVGWFDTFLRWAKRYGAPAYVPPDRSGIASDPSSLQNP
jgi:hypothetical protein